MTDDITDISGIGPKTEKKLRKKLRKNRPTSRAGEKVSLTDVERNQAVAKFVLAADQQEALVEAGSRFTPDREVKQKIAKKKQDSRERSESDTIRRGDFRVSKDKFKSARERFKELPDDERSEDKNSRDPVVTDLDVWSDNIGRLDYPGVDTPSNRRVRTEDTDIALNDTNGLTRPRETFRNSKPEPDEAQRQLGIKPKGADAERTGLVRGSDGEFIERPLRPTDSGAFRSANGRTVTGGLQDPTIGRDPDDGEFVDLPAGGEPSVPLPDTGGMGGPSDVVGEFVQGGEPDSTESRDFDRRETVGVTPDTLGEGFTIQTENDRVDRSLGKGSDIVERADEQVGLPDPDSAESTDVVAEVEVGLEKRERGFGYNAEVVETRESDDTIFNFR